MTRIWEHLKRRSTSTLSVMLWIIASGAMGQGYVLIPIAAIVAAICFDIALDMKP